MIDDKFILALDKICEYSADVELSQKTTFSIGGKTPLFITPNNRLQLERVIDLCKEYRVDYRLLGVGSNVLVEDGDLGYVVISTLGLNQCYINRLGFVYAEAGVRLGNLVNFTVKHELSGLEYLVGIPGSVGGAVVMNAGAFGSEIAEAIAYVDVYQDGRVFRVKKENLFFEYRHSVFTNNKKCAIIGVGFWLKRDALCQITKRMQFATQQRMATQKVGYPSAGSIFKKTTALAPAFMIQECGLKGFTIGGAQVSQIHSGYIVNIGSATCQDVRKVIHYVRSKVLEAYGVELQLEIILL